MTKVVLASQSKLKKEVVQKFFNEHLPPTVKREFHFIAAPSNINEQPIGTSNKQNYRFQIIQAAYCQICKY
jgi:non-canonical (house-cleaning) NTP pyrophosphatase